MMSLRKNSLAALRFAERRQREDEAPRLSTQVPDLVTLKLEIEERYGAGAMKHTRRVVVDRAPALFLVPCGDPRCTDSEHDLTSAVMIALRARLTSFEGSDECGGTLGSAGNAYCSRTLHFHATAEYRRASRRRFGPRPDWLLTGPTPSRASRAGAGRVGGHATSLLWRPTVVV